MGRNSFQQKINQRKKKGTGKGKKRREETWEEETVEKKPEKVEKVEKNNRKNSEQQEETKKPQRWGKKPMVKVSNKSSNNKWATSKWQSYDSGNSNSYGSQQQSGGSA